MFNNMFPDSEIAHSVQRDGEMEAYHLDLISRLDLPITLNPETATLDDIRLHGITEQYLSPSTVEKHIRYLKFMEKHPQPVNLKQLDIIDFKQHIRYRLFIEKASAFAIHHEYKAIKMLQRSFGQPPWDIRLPPMPRHKKRNIPLPENVREFWHYKYSKKRYERKLYQYMFYHAFLEGMRTPSELANLRIDDIRFLSNKKALLTILETKKHHSIREIALPVYLATDPLHKSYKNWLTSWRHKAENSSSGDYLFIQPNGRPFTTRHLGKKLKQQGCKVWKYFQPYCTRHWCAIARLIETKIKTGDFRPYTVRNWLGHETIKTTEGYIRYADQYFDLAPYNWVQRVLRHPRRMGDCTLNPTEQLKSASPVFSTGEEGDGPEEIWSEFIDKKKRGSTLKNGLSVFQPTLFSLFFININGIFFFVLIKQNMYPVNNKAINQQDYFLFGESKGEEEFFGTGEEHTRIVSHFHISHNHPQFFSDWLGLFLSFETFTKNLLFVCSPDLPTPGFFVGERDEVSDVSFLQFLNLYFCLCIVLFCYINYFISTKNHYCIGGLNS